MMMQSYFQFRFAALLFFAATTTCSADRLVDPTFFVEGQIAYSYDPLTNEFDPPLKKPLPAPLLDMTFTVGNDNPYILASSSEDEITLYSVFTGYENAYKYYLPDGWDPKPRLINTIPKPNESSLTPKFALSDGGVTSYLASTDGDEIVTIRRSDYWEEPLDVLAAPLTVFYDSISIPAGVTAMAFEPGVKNTDIYLKLALGRPNGMVEIYQNTNYLDFPMTKAAEFSAGTDDWPVEQIGYSNSYSVSPFWMVVVTALPEGNSGLKLYEENNYVAPRKEHVFEAKIRDFVFSNDNSKLAVLLSDGNILVYGESRNNFDTLIATIPANATALAFHANGELLYAGTPAPATVKTYSTRTWQEVSAAPEDSAHLDFCDYIHKMIFRPVRSELESNKGITALWNEKENVMYELALLTSKEDGTVPDLIAVFRVESDENSTPTVAPTDAATETAAPTAASGAMLPQSKREWTALVAFVMFGCYIV
jgi:WD40 repeat protein